jgi:hypothetical protein
MNRHKEGSIEKAIGIGRKFSRPLLGALAAFFVLSQTVYAQTGDRFPHSAEAIRPDINPSINSSKPAFEAERVRDIPGQTRAILESPLGNHSGVPSVMRAVFLAAESIHQTIDPITSAEE